LSLLVGEEAGDPDANGTFPEGSVNALVVDRLRAIAEVISEEELREAEREHKVEALAEVKPCA
jgi:hypothetical protein